MRLPWLDSLIAWAMRRRQIILTLCALCMLFGIYALLVMPRQEFPELVVREGLVVGVYPGATSAEVEEQLTRKVEEFLFSFEQVNRDETWSISQEGRMYLFVELRDNVKDVDAFWLDVRHGLNELKMGLPRGVLALIANNKFGDAAALVMALHAPGRGQRELKEYLDLLEDHLRELPALSTLKHMGLQQEQISIYLDNEKLTYYGISPVALLAALRLEGEVSYAGDLELGAAELPIHLPARFDSESDIANQIVYTDPRGIAVRLKDVARVSREYEDVDSYVQIDGEPCLILTLEMNQGNNIVQFGKEVDRVLAEVRQQLPPDVEVDTIADMPLAVDNSVSGFLHEFLIAVIAVVLVTMLLLPLRVASIAALTIPITVLISIGLLNAVGIELHTVSLAALIVVLGMVVDNTIVVVDNYVEQLDQGVSPREAASRSVSEVFIPVISATLAIIAAFLPMSYLMTGIAGDFTQPFPTTIAITLIVSLLVATFLVPIMTYAMIKRGLKHGDTKSRRPSMLDHMQILYDRLLGQAFRHKAVVVLFALGMLVLTLILGSGLDNQFGPKMDRNQFAVEIYLANGSSLDRTAQAADSLQNLLLTDARVTHVTAFVGTSSPRFHTLYAPQVPGSNYAQLIVNTADDDATVELVQEYADSYQSPIPEATCRFRRIFFGVAKSPVEVRLTGKDLPVMHQTAEEIKSRLRAIEGVGWVRDDFGMQLHGLRLVVNEDEANRLGISKSAIAYTVAAATEGLPLATVWEGDYPVGVRLKQLDSEVQNSDDLLNIYVNSWLGSRSARVRNLTTLQPDASEGHIMHRNGVRCITVSADLTQQGRSHRVMHELAPQLAAMQLPPGISLSYGGDFKDSQDNYIPLAKSLAVSVAVIFFILLFQFSTIRLAMLVMSIIPLCLFGAVIGLISMGYPFSLTAFIGVISLVGMVIRNGIIYMDYAEHLRTRQGMTLEEAAMAAGRRRMRPIFLTASAAAVGVIPMIVSRSPLWGPLGTVVCFGLLLTMLLTLVVLPVLYSLLGPGRSKDSSHVSHVAGLFLLLLMTASVTHPAQAQTRLTLQDCQALALQHNAEYLNAQEELKAAREVRGEARTHYFPSASASILAMRAKDPMIEIEMEGGNLPVYDGNPANIASASQYAYFPGVELGMLDELSLGSVTVTQPLFAGGRIINGNRLAQVGVEVREQQLALKHEEMHVDVEARYCQLIALDQQLSTLDAYEQMLLELEAQVTDAYQGGLVLRNDLLKVQLERGRVQVNKTRLRNGRHLAQMAFCQFLGLERDTDIELQPLSFSQGGDTLQKVDHALALTTRHETLLLAYASRAAELNQTLALGECLPTLAIGVTVYRMTLDDKEAENNALGFLSLSVPLTDWWGGSHKIAAERGHRRIAETNQADKAELMLVQMDKCWLEYCVTCDQLELMNHNLELAQQDASVSEDSYQNGVISMSELLEARAGVLKAQSELIDARIELRMASLRYLQATGQLRP